MKLVEYACLISSVIMEILIWRIINYTRILWFYEFFIFNLSELINSIFLENSNRKWCQLYVKYSRSDLHEVKRSSKAPYFKGIRLKNCIEIIDAGMKNNIYDLIYHSKSVACINVHFQFIPHKIFFQTS